MTHTRRKNSHRKTRKDGLPKRLEPWLEAHIGQPWSQVYAKLVARCPAHERNKPNGLEDELSRLVDFEHEPGWSGLVVDSQGILRDGNDYVFPIPLTYSRRPLVCKPDSWPREWPHTGSYFERQGLIATAYTTCVGGEYWWMEVYAYELVTHPDGTNVLVACALRRTRRLTREEICYMQSLTGSSQRSLRVEAAIAERRSYNRFWREVSNRHFGTALAPFPELTLME